MTIKLVENQSKNVSQTAILLQIPHIVHNVAFDQIIDDDIDDHGSRISNITLLFWTGSKKKSIECVQLLVIPDMSVEGLLKNGAMKPDDRPLWYDVYKAFPPAVEPKFARPKPEIKPIRPILYKEDVVRAKFHSNGHGLGAINMLSSTGETQTKKLLQQYEKLKSEGVAEEELMEKAASVVESDRQEFVKAKVVPKNPESVTAQVINADLKNIFNEK